MREAKWYDEQPPSMAYIWDINPKLSPDGEGWKIDHWSMTSAWQAEGFEGLANQTYQAALEKPWLNRLPIMATLCCLDAGSTSGTLRRRNGYSAEFGVLAGVVRTLGVCLSPP